MSKCPRLMFRSKTQQRNVHYHHHHHHKQEQQQQLTWLEALGRPHSAKAADPVQNCCYWHYPKFRKEIPRHGSLPGSAPESNGLFLVRHIPPFHNFIRIRQQLLELSTKLVKLPLRRSGKIPLKIPRSVSWSGSRPKSNHRMTVTPAIPKKIFTKIRRRRFEISCWQTNTHRQSENIITANLGGRGGSIYIG